MSFIVSYKGQFQPYQLPDLSHYDRVRNVFKAKKTDALKENEFDNELERQAPNSKHSSSSSQAISAYQKTNKEFKKEQIPHLARDIMSSNVILIKSRANYTEALEVMEEKGFRHLPVIDDSSTLIGIISHRDLLTAQPNQSVDTIMTSEVLTCLDSTRIQDMAKIMLHEKLGALPIINEKHELVGIVTQTDILQFVTRILSINDLF